MFASYIDNAKVSSAIMTTLTRGDYTKATRTTSEQLCCESE